MSDLCAERGEVMLYDALTVVGFLFSFCCIAAGLFFVAGLWFNYCWNKYCDFDSFARVVREAKRQGVALHKREGK